MINQFPITVQTCGSGLFLTPYWYLQFRWHIVWRADPTVVWIIFIRKWRYKFIPLLQLVPWCVSGSPFGAIGTIALYLQKISISNSAFKSVSMSVSVSLTLSLSLPFSVSLSLSVSLSVSVLHTYGAMNIYVRHGNYVVDSQGSYEVMRKIKRPPSWERMGTIS